MNQAIVLVLAAMAATVSGLHLITSNDTPTLQRAAFLVAFGISVFVTATFFVPRR